MGRIHLLQTIRRCLSVQGSVVVLCSIVDDQFVFGEEEAVALHLPRPLDDFLRFFLRQFWQVVNEFPGVGGVGDDEAELELVRPDHFPIEVVSLHHQHVLNWFLPIAEFEGQSNRPQLQKVRAQVVLDDSGGRVVAVLDTLVVNVLILHLHQRYPRHHVPDLEASKLDVGPIVRQLTQEFSCWLLQISDIVWVDAL